MSEIRKQKKIKGRSLPGLLPVQPSQLAGPASRRPSRLPPLSSSSRQREGSVAGARARHRATPPARLPACPPLLARCPGRRHASPPALSHSPSVPPSSPSLSLSHGRTPPSPPFAIATVSGHPSLPRLAQKLRHDPLFLPTAPRVPGSPASPPRRRSPLRAPTIVAVEFVVSSSSPSPLRRPLQPR